MVQIDLDKFIDLHVTGREKSLFHVDVFVNKHRLSQKIDGKSVMVIGGAGTIGSAFVREILKFQPGRLFVVDINENGLTELTRDLRSSSGLNVPRDYKTYPIDFGGDLFEKLYRKEGPFDIVANFAAHKHVRSEKDHYSIEAMLENNVLKAERLLRLLSETPPQHFFCVSTDKAANPVNVMGATKKLMEELIMAYSTDIPITTARFANVAFSNGSLPFGFLNRLMKRQPLSAPKDIKRYFVSPEESGQLCLLACLLGSSGDIFFPKIHSREMKTFTGIAENLLAEIGYSPEYCVTEEEARSKARSWDAAQENYPVYFFESDTSGEKPFEEFYTRDEKLDLSSYECLGVIKSGQVKPKEPFRVLFDKLLKLFDKPDLVKAEIVEVLKELIPEFQHKETDKSLDEKM